MIKEVENGLTAWLITGVAGFIGSNLLEALLHQGQLVVGIDNFSTGFRKNIDEALSAVPTKYRGNFKLITGDIRNVSDIELCFSKETAVWLSENSKGVKNGLDIVLHQAALGSVPRSMEDPLTTNAVNISGFLNVLDQSRQNSVKRIVYAASSSTYGDHPIIPKKEENIGKPLSPYAVTKLCNELYADVFNRSFGTQCIGLRYFNVFGKRQDPNGAYAAVIPKWIKSMLLADEVVINGDGQTTRDFCYIENVIQANIRASLISWPDCDQQVYNIAFGAQTSLNELYNHLAQKISAMIEMEIGSPIYVDFRPGDVLHSLADISKAKEYLHYEPTHDIENGLKESLSWYLKEFGSN